MLRLTLKEKKEVEQNGMTGNEKEGDSCLQQGSVTQH